MVASHFIDLFTGINYDNRVAMEDFSDRLSLFTVVLFILACIAVSVKQYLFNSISCYIPVKPSGSNYDDYLIDYCWVHGTIPLRADERMPSTPQAWADYDRLRRITYYQWIPFVLAMQGILSYLPHVLWQYVSTNRSSGDLFKLVKLASEAAISNRADREKQVHTVAQFMEDMLDVHRDFRNGRRAHLSRQTYKTCGSCVVSKRMGTCLVWSYIGVKLLALLNALAQIILIQHFLGFYPEGSIGQKSMLLGEFKDPKTVTVYDPSAENASGFIFGWTVLRHIWSGRDWPETLIFPRVAYCRVPGIRVVGGENSYTAQCALPVNMLNEKIYIFFWFWIAFLFTAILTSLIMWFSFMLWAPRRKSMVERFLRIKRIMSPDDRALTRDHLVDFTDNYLRRDGVFILRMLVLNAGEIITSDVVAELYAHYLTMHPHPLEEDSRTFKEGHV